MRKRPMTPYLTTNTDLAEIKIPDSKLAREITELVRDTESSLLFHHSSRVYYWGASACQAGGARFHVGLRVQPYRHCDDRQVAAGLPDPVRCAQPQFHDRRGSCRRLRQANLAPQ